jgi:hypothetical protein
MAALIVTVAMGITGVSGATALSLAASGTPIPSTSRAVGNTAAYPDFLSRMAFFAGKFQQRNMGCSWCTWSGNAFGGRSHQSRGSAARRPTSAALVVPAFFEFAPLTTAPSTQNSIAASTDVAEMPAMNIAFVSDKNPSPAEFAGTVVATLETGTSWRSNSFSIAGSRIWSKIIKFSSHGINVRVPLN